MLPNSGRNWQSFQPAAAGFLICRRPRQKLTNNFILNSEEYKMKSIAAFVLMLSAALNAAMTFDDIDVWVGEGANRAALVIDWNNGPSELVKVWGFRWDGQATGADMVLAICQADAFLYAMATVDINEGTAFGGFGYDADGDSLFGISKGVYTGSFNGGGIMTVGSDAHFDGWDAVGAGDVWESGWFVDGYWAYFGLKDGAWDYPGSGASARVLADGAWDGWSWSSSANGWWGGDPSVTVIPEPATLVLLGAGLLLARKRK
jgi:hypothetical protein